MKIAVTGATGQLGTIAIEKLKEKTSAENIIALVRDIDKAKSLGVEARIFDYNNPKELVAALTGVDKLLLISGNEIGKRSEQHANVINAAKAAGVKHIVYTSLLKADTSTLVLAGEHLDTEKMIKDSGLNYTIMRHGWYTENYTVSLPDIISHGVLLGSSGEGRISSATREDYAQADVNVLIEEGHENKTYELAGDESFTMNDMALEISKQTGKEIPYNNIPVEDYTKVLIEAGLPEGMAQFFAGTHVSTEKGDLFYDGKELSTLLKRPTTSLSQAIKNAL